MSPSVISNTLPDVPYLSKILNSESEPLPRRFRALTALKHVASQQSLAQQSTDAIKAIADAFKSPSALLKHELAYCLGQSYNLEAAKYLRDVLEDGRQDAMSRHEAAEALGALGDQASIDLLQRIRDTPNEEVVVRETCEIAVERLKWERSKTRHEEVLKESDFASIDPAPPMPLDESRNLSIASLERTLMNTTLPLFTRYRAMFALRDLASPPNLPTAIPAVQALARGFEDSSALFRHEIAFVYGQLCHPASIPYLKEVLSNRNELGMVRHEAAEALGSLGAEVGVEAFLNIFLDDPEQVVRESVVVALDMADFAKDEDMDLIRVE
jgi:deoxyhypusine monooxygenase